MQKILDSPNPTSDDMKLAADSSQVLSANFKEGNAVQLVFKEDPSKSITLPSSTVSLLIEILEHTAKGKALTIYSTKIKRHKEREQALDELTSISQNLNLGYEE